MADADWLARHVRLLRASYRHWTGRDLISPGLDDTGAIAALDQAGFAVVSHDTRDNPVFNYGNRLALQLFEMSWTEFTALPSRFSAEPLRREERARLLQRVTRDGFIDDYAGVRISRSGRRFLVSHATVWNLLDEAGCPYGQAARLPQWELLPDSPDAA